MKRTLFMFGVVSVLVLSAWGEKTELIKHEPEAEVENAETTENTNTEIAEEVVTNVTTLGEGEYFRFKDEIYSYQTWEDHLSLQTEDLAKKLKEIEDILIPESALNI
ncbi:hypothetical protein [Alkalihalobacterium elongatum]|uniref:hypothetical protein n=1 Tax=Alkalihalobacterium elongatum TaxID=2675466 RepID=UPI001C1F9510|nr:hypothetical protein [Alkalihalobacterium elongatum]